MHSGVAIHPQAMAISVVLLLLLPLLTPARCSCGPPQHILLALAFSSVSNFVPPQLSAAGDCIQHLRLPSRNLSGAISWMFLRNITSLQTIDLSGNALEGSIPGGFWSAPALAEVNLAANNLGGPLRFDRSGVRLLNLSGNRFTAATDLSRLGGLRVLDLSRNKLRVAPSDMKSLPDIEYLDVSENSMAGEFPAEFPKIAGLRFLNVSCNNLTGKVDFDALKKFGSSAFAKSGVFNYAAASGKRRSGDYRGKARNLRKGVIAGAAAAAGVVFVGVVIVIAFCCGRKRWLEKGRGSRAAAEEVGWVREARWGAAVVMFEKPLMDLRFADLAAATSGFGNESLMAEGGRSGPVYRAVLPGDMHVVVRVMESDQAVDEKAAAEAFREISRLRHPNLLPLLGYCISGRERLLLYEYMERGDLHRWLHELPAGLPDGEDWSSDTWENPPAGVAAASAVGDWPTRHRIALGVARGLAFLHQCWDGTHTPVVHGHLIPSNILLSDDLEPRIADFAFGGVSGEDGATAEDDVYSYGVVVMELLTGNSRWPEEEVERVRGIVRHGKLAAMVDAVDRRMLLDVEWEKEAVECLKVGYFCTARSPEKRPSMQQVVALLKDIRQVAATGDGDVGGDASTSSYF